MVSRNIQIPDEMYAKLKEIAQAKGLTISAVIKVACDEYIKKQEQK